MNPFNKIPDFCCLDSGPDAYVASAASFHPGGANFGFADGSVKFLKDSISSLADRQHRRQHDDPGHRQSQRQQPARRRGFKRLSGRPLPGCQRWLRVHRPACSSACTRPSRAATATRSSAPTSIDKRPEHDLLRARKT